MGCGLFEPLPGVVGAHRLANPLATGQRLRVLPTALGNTTVDNETSRS